MSAMSNYLEQQLLTHLFRTGSFAKPTTLYFALASGTLDETMNGGLGGLEMPNAGSYARVAVSPSDANFTAVGEVAGSGETQNANTITFPKATADWGTATDIAILDNGTYGSGNVLLFGKMQTAKLIGVNDTFSFDAGQFQFYLD